MNKVIKMKKSEEINSEALLCMGMWGMIGILIFIGAITGKEITCFFAIFFAGDTVKNGYKFIAKKERKDLYLAILKGGVMVACIILYIIGWTW